MESNTTTNPFQAPSEQAPAHDWKSDPLYDQFPITYRAGQLVDPAVGMFFGGRLYDHEIKRGFEVYNPTDKVRDKIPKLTCYLIGIYFGSFSDGEGVGQIRFKSNLVEDTKTDVLESFYFMPDGAGMKRKRLAIGNYKDDIKPALQKEGRGGGYTKVMVCYVQELRRVCAIHLSAVAEAGLVEAIAEARKKEVWKVGLYGLTDLQNEIWCFLFDGQYKAVAFTPRDQPKVGATRPATEKDAKLYFQPVFMAGVITPTTPKFEKAFVYVNEKRNEYAAYIASEQAHLRGQWKGKPDPAAQPSPVDQATTQPEEDFIASAPPAFVEDDRFPSNDDYNPYASEPSYQAPGPDDDLPF